MHEVKTKTESLRLLSLNVKGISNFRKRRAVFTWCRKQKADVIFLHETHSTEEREKQWIKEWGSQIYFSHGSSNSRGVAILLKKGIDIVGKKSFGDTCGGFIVIESKINDEEYILINVYAPNKDEQSVKFFHSLFNIMRQNEYYNEDNIIIGGDFNCRLNPEMDKNGGILIPRQNVIDSIEEIQCTFSLHDKWRIQHPNTRSYTWSRKFPFIFSRLDYWLISDNLHDFITTSDILPATDHSAILLGVQKIEESRKGPGYWKLNTSLLANENYINMIRTEMPTWIKDGKLQ